ncbi:MAG: nucleotidyltransferase domain-containing protein, partial [bacterium]
VSALQRSLGPSLVSAVLFGSVARGEAGPTSDVDLLVVVEGLPASRLGRHDVLAQADEAVEPLLEALRRDGIHTDVYPILKTPEEARRLRLLYLDMVEDAVLLHDRDGFFRSVLDRMRESLRRLGARRLRIGRVRYWDLKPDYRPGEVFEL